MNILLNKAMEGGKDSGRNLYTQVVIRFYVNLHAHVSTRTPGTCLFL